MNTAGERVQALIVQLGLNRNAFAQKIGVSSTVINGVVKDDHKPGNKILDGIMREYPNVNTDWILSGIGSMFRSEQKPVEPATFGAQVAERILLEFEKLREQLAIKDKQLEAALETSKGLQRTIDALINRPGVASGSNFLNDVAADRSVIRMHPATQLIVKSIGAVA